MGGKTNTVTQSANPTAAAAYNTLIPQIESVASTPYVPFSGQGVAPVNTQQYAGIGGINNAANFASPSIETALNYLQSSANPLTTGQIQQYENPYTQSVVNATQNQFNNSNAQQQQQFLSSQASQGALGGSGTARGQAILSGQQQLSEAPTIAGLENTGYNNAVQVAMNQFQQNPQAAATALGNTAVAGQNAALTGAGAQITAGSLEQNTQQAQDTFNYQQWLQQLAYPFQTTGWETGQIGSIGPDLGGSTTYPSPSVLGQIAGLGLSSGAILGGTGAFGATGYLNPSYSGSIFSDERLKEGIKEVGKTHDGQKIYRFRYRGEPEWHLGLLAQEVEKKHPEAVTESGGFRMVHVKKATDLAAHARARGGGIPGLAVGGVPYGGDSGLFGGAAGYVPQEQQTAHPQFKAPTMQWQPETATQMFTNAAGMVKGLGLKPNASANNPSGSVNGGTGSGLFGPQNSGGGQGMGGWSMSTPSIGSSGVPWGSSSTPDVSAGSTSYGYMNRGGVARKRGGYVRAGLGLSSFVPRLADGGTPEDAITMPPASFDDRFNAVDPGGISIVPETMPPAGSPASFDDRFNAAGPQTSDAFAGNPPPASQAGIGLGADVPLPQPRPAGAPIAGLQMLPPEITNGQSPGAAPAQPPATFDRFVNGIAHNETGGERNPYGSVVSTGTGHRVFGKYQVYDENIPKWTQEALGHPLTPQQFLASPEAQEATARYKLGEYVDKYGYHGAARAWLAGEGGMNNPQARDKFGSDPYGYATKALAHAGIGAEGHGGDEESRALGYSGAAPSGGTGEPIAGIGTRDHSSAADQKGLSSDFWQSMLAAGLGMMASKSPFPGVAIGEGGMQGLAQYGALQKEHREQSKDNAEIDLRVKQLQQAAKFHQDQIARESQHFNELSAAQKAEQEFHDREARRQEMQPVKIGTDFNGDIYAVRDPATGGYRRIDPNTGTLAPIAGIGTGAAPSGNAGVGLAPAPAPSLQPGVNPQTGIGEKTGRNEGYLATLPPMEQELIKGIADYRKDPRQLGYKQKTAINAAVTRYDPSYRDDIYPQISQTETAFNKGKQGDSIQAYNNALGHMDTLLSYGDAMKNGNIQALNSLKNTIQTQFGKAAPNTFDGIKSLVADEVVKSIVPGAGGEAERMQLAEKIKAASSPDQLRDLIGAFKELGGRQLYDLKLRYNNGTYGKRSDFEEKLSKEGLDEMRRIETARGETPVPTRRERALVKAHPELKEKFVKYFGVQP
jgi:hypothetical protein